MHCPCLCIAAFFYLFCRGGFLISNSVFFIWISLVWCSAAKKYPSSIQRIGKGPFQRCNFTSILGPLRRIHFHFAKYSSLLIQCSFECYITEAELSGVTCEHSESCSVTRWETERKCILVLFSIVQTSSHFLKILVDRWLFIIFYKILVSGMTTVTLFKKAKFCHSRFFNV